MRKKALRLPPVHPGEVLYEDLMKPLGITINRLARDLRVPPTRISEISALFDVKCRPRWRFALLLLGVPIGFHTPW